MFSKKYCFRLSPWNIYTSQFLHIFTVSWTLYFFEQVLQKFQLSPLNFMYVEQNITLKQSLLRTSACFKWLTLHVKITCREKNVSSYTTFSFFFWGSLRVGKRGGGGVSRVSFYIFYICIFERGNIYNRTLLYSDFWEGTPWNFILLFVREFIIGGYQNPHQNTID